MFDFEPADKPRSPLLFKLVVILSASVLLIGCLTHDLQSGLTEQDAQEIVVLLNENSIDASATKVAAEKKGEEKWTVAVRGGDQNLARAWRVLQDNGLPRQKDKGLEDVFSNSGMIPTATEEKARLLSGVSGEISHALKSVTGIVDAHVLVVLPESSPLLDKSERVAPTASVLIKYRGSELPLTEDEIKKLVARAVEGLQPENVAVVSKRVVPGHSADRSLIPLLGNQEFLLVSLALLGVSSIGCLALVGKSRWQRSKLETLQQQLQSAQRHPLPAQLPDNPSAAKAARIN
jgi:type III secretion protein J